MKRASLWCAALIAVAQIGPAGQQPDWKQVEAEAFKTLTAYVRLNTSNPPGDVTPAADLLTNVLRREGIDVKRFESGPGRAIVLARLKGDGSAGKAILLENHMDVVPTDPSRWSRDPFGAEVADGKMWGRGTIDMKGIGVTQLYAFIQLHRQKVPLKRDVLLMSVPDEEVGGTLGAEWMRKNHYDELDPEYVDRRRGASAAATCSPRASSCSASRWPRRKSCGSGCAPRAWPATARSRTGRTPTITCSRALHRLFARADGGGAVPRHRDDEAAHRRPLAANKFNNAIQKSTISLTSLRSGVGDPPKVNVIPSVAEATIDCRVLPGTTAAQWLRAVEQRLADPTIKIEVINEGEDPVVTPAGHAFLSRARIGAQAASSRRDRDADGRALRHRRATAFVRAASRATAFFPGIMPAASILSMHGDAEFMPVDALGPAIQILYEVLVETTTR